MNKKKIVCITLLIIMSFYIVVPMFNNNVLIPSVFADSESFFLKDGFEDYIKNRIYTKWYNMSEDYIGILNETDSWDWNEGDLDNWYGEGDNSDGYPDFQRRDPRD